jgi:hypothetical protein
MSHTEQPTQAPHAGQHAPVPEKGSNGLATAGFVLGLLGLLSSWIPFLNIVGIILGVIGAVLAAVGLAKSKKVNAGKGLAIAGLVLGALAVIIAVLINAVFVSAVDKAVEETTSTSVEAPSDAGDEAASDDEAAPDAELELGTTRDKPAPLGSAISGDDWTVKINSVKTISKDSIGQTPAAGSTLLAINMTATYNGDDEQGSTPWATVKFVSADGTTIDSTSGSTLFMAENDFDSLKTVYNGASVKGDQLLEVPADNWRDGVLAVSPGILSDDTFVAVK